MVYVPGLEPLQGFCLNQKKPHLAKLLGQLLALTLLSLLHLAKLFSILRLGGGKIGILLPVMCSVKTASCAAPVARSPNSTQNIPL